MKHFKLIGTAVLLCAAGPAFAEPDDRDVQRHLPPAGEIEAMGDTAARVADAVMDVEIGPVIDAVDPRARDRDRPETLGDLATRDDPDARERIRDSIGRTAFGIEAMIAQIAVIAPVLRRGIEDAVDRVDEAMDRAERPRRD